MPIPVIELLSTGGRWTRDELVFNSGKDDRSVRDEIRTLRRKGFPVLGLPGGGYKLAATDFEKSEMLHQIKGRALDLLKTYALLERTMDVDGQITLDELLGALEPPEVVQ